MLVVKLQQHASKRSKLAIVKDKADTFKELFLEWLIESENPFYCVENNKFRQLLRFLNPDLVDKLLPRAHSTVKNWIISRYKARQEGLKKELQVAQSDRKSVV